MGERRLLLEGLPDNLDRVKSKLQLYFKNKRRSGGEIVEIREYPQNKRQALLIYSDQMGIKNVLDKRVHRIDFKGHGTVDLTVKLLEEQSPDVERPTPPAPPRSKPHTLEDSEGVQSGSEIHMGNKENTREHNLLINTEEPVDKDTLTMYFEQFAEHVEIINHGENCWILKLTNQSDLQKILTQKVHEFGLSVEAYEDGCVPNRWDPHRFILSGFKDACKLKLITVFIGSCSKKADHTWELLDDDRIVVTFTEDIDAPSFLKKCASKKLQDMEIRAVHLELTDSVLVEGDVSSLQDDILALYFSNRKRSGGGVIKSIVRVTDNNSVIISFEDCYVAQKVVERQHRVCETDLGTFLFYPSLNKTLKRKMSTLPNIPTSIIIPFEEDILIYIEKSESNHKRYFENQLKMVHANVTFDNTTTPRVIVLEMDVDRETLAALRVGPTWESKAKNEALAFLRKYSKSELDVEVEVWNRIKSECLRIVTLDVEVSFKDDKCKIVGLLEQVSALSDKIRSIIKVATAELEVERNTIDKEIKFDSKEMFELVAKNVRSKIIQSVNFSQDESSLTFHVGGLKDEVNDAVVAVKRALDNVVFQHLKLSSRLLQFLKSLDLKKIEQDHFVKSDIAAYFQNDGDFFGIIVEKENLKRVEKKIEEILKEEIIQLTPDPASVMNNDNWINFLKSLKAELELSHNAHNVSITSSKQQVFICGFAQVVADISQKVKYYLEKKTPATEDVHLKSLQEVEFVDSCMNLSEIPELRNLGVTTLACTNEISPCIKVTTTKENIQNAVGLVRKHVSSICMEKQTYSKAGESKVIHKHEAIVNAKTREWNCKVYISTQKGCVQPVKYSHKINDSITLTIAEGNLLHCVADAFICPMNSSLAFVNPIAQEFLQVAGSQIQGVLNNIQKQKQTLLAGDVVLSDPGNLQAKTLIYAVLPQSGQSLSSHYLESVIFESLQEAEKKSCASIAMPAIGRGTFGFSIRESCVATRAALQKFCNDSTNSTTNMKNIFVVDPDVKTVEEYNAFIAQMGFSYTSAHPTNTASKVQSDTEVTVRGVLVSLKKGDITKETVDVIVNSTNKTLDLNSGVSGAILSGAGKSVEDECKTHGPQKDDGVVFTSGGNLACKYIAQMVGPPNAGAITVSIEKVLDLCESKMAVKVAIPAIGTGRGGIGPNESMKAIFAGLENHLAKSKSSCLKEIIVVVFEQKILDSYCSYFKERKKKPSPTGTQAPHTTIPANKVKIAGVWIEVRKGNITNETVRGIVNTTNDQMNLTGGVSGAILRAAGPSVEQECQKHGKLQGDTAAVTSGGNLQCDYILHMMGPHSAADATLRVKKVLERCEENQISTISFPAVGTGGGGLKNMESINAMLQGFKDHLSTRASTALKLIYVVIDRDEVLKDFLEELKQWTAKTQDTEEEDDEWEDEEESMFGSDDGSVCSEEEDIGNDSTTEAVIGPIKVKVHCGDITKQTTEAIVSSTNTSLNLNTGVSGAILKAAGQSVEAECKKLGTQPSDGVVLTTAGNLPFKNIVHMVGQTKEKELTRCMYKVLKKCEENSIQSVSFPALGTGAGNLAASQVACAMIDAVANFSIDSPVVLKSVHIVIFQPKMLQDFQDALKKFKKISPSFSGQAKQTQSAPNPVSTKPGQHQTQSAPNPVSLPLCLSAATSAVTFPVTNVEVFGTSTVDLAKVKKYLEDLISDECTSKDIQSPHLARLPTAEKEAVVAFSESNQVRVLVVAPDKWTVSGKKDDVLDAALKINNFLQEARDRETRESEESRVRETLCWEKAEGNAWVPLESSISYRLELAFHKKEQTLTYQEKGETYKVDFKEMKVENRKGKSCRIKRTLLGDSETAIIHPPPTWNRMDGKDLEIITLHPDTQEYKNIEKDFVHSSKHQSVAAVQVVQIQRIQSQRQWQRYSVLKQAVDKKYPKQKNEQFLYHGTTKDICEKINKNGFNRSFCGRNAVVHGDGTYFAKEAWYSCQDQYSNKDENGLKYIYKARVVTGTPCKSTRGMKEPDPLDPNDPKAGLHDCAVDNLQSPFIFVVFCDAGAYPDYLITFKNV
ncbi:poly(ADP-ribose) polymerase family member 14-related sequence 3 isoform X2 [Brachyhypopomus gauderio]|uniref:poly(ADP-ribose) polymerase family member 14-related sequence 3 isoform X2 n=1 Tax=Brachyhypopomus gauderio TaxID=698409 RepID=UPI00404118F7